MDQLAVINQNALVSPQQALVLERLPQIAQGIVRAKVASKTIPDMFKDDAVVTVNLVSMIIADGIKTLGHWNQLEQSRVLEFMQEKMITLLMGKYNRVTIHEFKLSVEKLCTGEYKKKSSDVIVVSVESMCYAIDCFLIEEFRKMALADFNIRLMIESNKPKIVLTEEDKLSIVRDGCNKAWEQFKKDGTLPLKCCPYYDEIKRVHNITWTTDEYAKIKQEATEIYNQKIIAEKRSGNLNKAQFNLKLKEQKDGVLIECKRICLRILFERSKDKPFK